MAGGGCCACCAVGVRPDEASLVRTTPPDLVFLLGRGLLARRHRAGDRAASHDLRLGLRREICVLAVRKLVCDGVVWVSLPSCGQNRVKPHARC